MITGLGRGAWEYLSSRHLSGGWYDARPHVSDDPLRDVWNGLPVVLGIAWTLKKRDHVAQCVLFSHQFGWELRLEVGELFRTQACRSTEETLDTQEAWKASMLEKGWAPGEPFRTLET